LDVRVKISKRTWKRIVIVLTVALGIYLTIGVLLAGRGLPPVPPSVVPVDLHGGRVLGHRITTRSWAFDYGRAHLSADGSSGDIDDVKNGVVFRGGKPYLSISAEHVSINTDSLDFTAVGKVHVERIDDPGHRSFDTDLVTWTNATKLLTLSHPSYVHTAGGTLRIDKIVVDFNTDEIHLGKIGGKIEVKHVK
jgi:hypothetical protein